MNHDLEPAKIIEAHLLDSEFYVQSLLEQAGAKGMLGDRDMERLQSECLTLLADKVRRYNAGYSSSIRVEKAKDIMTSNLYTIGLWLKTLPSPDRAVAALRDEPIQTLYEKGRKRIGTMLATAKALHAKLLSQLVQTQNVFYRDTLTGGILGFFKQYDPDYAAQETHITADYPAFNSMPHLVGIEFIHRYLQVLYYENLFCGYFTADAIHHLLCGATEDYQEHLINIYEPVLSTALGCVMAKTDLYSLDLLECGAVYLRGLFAQMPQDRIAPRLQTAAQELCDVLGCPRGLRRYVLQSLPLIADTIRLAAENQTLHRVFFRPAFPENKPQIIFDFGQKMDDERYRRVIEEIRRCRFTQDKVAIVKEQIHSLADLEDVLLDADLTGEELQAVLGQLSPPEIAALSKKYGPLSPMDLLEQREQERLLQTALSRLIAGLPEKERDMIEKIKKLMGEP